MKTESIFEDTFRKISKGDPAKGRRSSLWSTGTAQPAKLPEFEGGRRRVISNNVDPDVANKQKLATGNFKLDRVKESLMASLMRLKPDDHSSSSDEGEGREKTFTSRITAPHLTKVIHGSRNAGDRNAPPSSDKPRTSVLQRISSFNVKPIGMIFNHQGKSDDDSPAVLIPFDEQEELESYFIFPAEILDEFAETKRKIVSMSERVEQSQDIQLGLQNQRKEIVALGDSLQKISLSLDQVAKTQLKASMEVTKMETQLKSIFESNVQLMELSTSHKASVTHNIQEIQSHILSLHDHLQSLGTQQNGWKSFLTILLAPFIAVIVFLGGQLSLVGQFFVKAIAQKPQQSDPIETQNLSDSSLADESKDTVGTMEREEQAKDEIRPPVSGRLRSYQSISRMSPFQMNRIEAKIDSDHPSALSGKFSQRSLSDSTSSEEDR
eukprot:TRINITY_DN3518_c0_g3_i2.p1 TRINITY_DN3518_c0_g3~~TRINITY_DN3518_c0_g3_i2.p1  ORF type:complete len:437 (-),score=76.99 TRINITY_DN3518_c0_g3_i2:753-2063(-)